MITFVIGDFFEINSISAESTAPAKKLFAAVEKKVLLYAVFSQLLLELKLQTGIATLNTRHENPLIAEALFWIDQNYQLPISLSDIAENLRVSPSSLSHTFRQELGISVYRYLTEKRLITAHSLITQGTPPTEAYLKCGWSDYSSFYRAYKRMFHTKPSETSSYSYYDSNITTAR